LKKPFLLPAYLLAGLILLRPHFSGAAYPFMQGFLLLPALIGLALILLAPRMVSIPSGKDLDRVLLLPWLLCGWSFLSIFWSSDPGRGVTVSLTLLLDVIVFTLVFFITRDLKEGDRFGVFILSFLLLPVLVRALYQHFFGMAHLRGFLEEMEAGGRQVASLIAVISKGRVFAGFLNSNMLAGFLAIFISITLDLAITTGDRGRRLFFSLLTIVQFGVLLLTGSMGGSLVAAVAAGLVFLVRKGIRRRDIVWIGIIGVIMVAGLVMVRGFSLWPGPDNSILQRIGYMKAGFLMAAEKPFLGWGAGSIPGAMMGYVAAGIRPAADPHNFLIRSWIAWGLPGITILVFFLFLWVKIALGPVREKGWRLVRGGYVGLLFGGVSFLLHSLVDMDFFVPEISLFGWVALAGSLALASREGGDPGREAAWFGKGVRWSLAGMALALVLPALIYLQGEFTAFKGNRAVQDGQYEEAAGLYREAGRLLPFQGRLLLEEGRARLAMGQREKAQALFVRASRKLKSSPYPSWELGRMALSEGDWEGSIPYLEIALERYPTSPRLLLDLAQAYHGAGDFSATVRFLEEAGRCAVFDGEVRRIAQKILEGSESQPTGEPMEAR